MRRVDFPTGTIHTLASILAAEAPAVATFNGIEVTAQPGATAESIVDAYRVQQEARHAAFKRLTARLAAMCEANGAEKFPGRLRLNPSAADMRQAIAYMRGELDELERALNEREW